MNIRRFGPVAILLSSLFALLFLAAPTFAAVRCETQYGGGQVCVTTGQLQVNKKVWDPGGKTYVDNLVASGTYRFMAGQEGVFQVKIQNLGSLAPGQTIERIIKARVINASQLPLAPSTVCDDRTTNFAEAHNPDSSDRDSSRVCVENRVLGKVTPPKVIPSTGPEQLVLLGLGLVGAAGVYLKAKIKGF